MANRKTKMGDTEKLTPENIQKVIQLLEAEKPITKKQACEILNIAYNTTRLGQIIDRYKEKQEYNRQRRLEKRGKPASQDEVKFVVESYLEGSSVEHISDTIHRGNTFVNSILEQYSVPIRSRSHNYLKPELIPEGAVRDRFKVGEIVYSARYDSTARIEGEFFQKNQWVYRIWLLSDRWRCNAYQEACELASLEHLKEVGVNV